MKITSLKSILIQLILATSLLLVVSCNNDNDPEPTGTWSKSVFIINEGPFQNGSGSVYAFNRETLGVTADLFESANGRPLGNIVQSISVFGNRAFIVVNNSNKIEVVNLEDFKSVATIDGLPYPRYFLAVSETKGYVTCWDSTVKVLNLADYSVSASVKTGTGPDEMVLSGNYLFVNNSGGFGTDSTVSVIRTDRDEFLENYVIGDRPSGITMDKSGKIWILCSGKGWNGFPDPGDTPARLVCLDPGTLGIVRVIMFPGAENHPDNLIINATKDTLYYNHPQGIFAFPVSSSALSAGPLVASDKMYYGIGYDERLKMIYAADPLDFSQVGWVYRFNAASGSLVDSFMVGVAPNGFWFNY